jgi:hypothetical protein
MNPHGASKRNDITIIDILTAMTRPSQGKMIAIFTHDLMAYQEQTTVLGYHYEIDRVTDASGWPMA